MPKLLLARCRPDSVAEFRSAATERFRDADELAARDRRTGAIYLWGYAAEMTLKAAYFDLIGFPPAQSLTFADLNGAKASASKYGFAWTGNLHNLESWGKLVVSARALIPGRHYSDARFGSEVAGQSRRLQVLWSETLRYHKNVAYPHEVEAARSAAQWFLDNSLRL